MHFEPSQTVEMLGTFLAEQTMSEVPIFGPDKAHVQERLQSASKIRLTASATVEHVDRIATPLPDSFDNAKSVSEKLRSLRACNRDEHGASQTEDDAHSHIRGARHLDNGPNDISLASNSLGSCREMHEGLLSSLVAAKGLPREAQCVVGHTMLLRAQEKYLFDAATNRNIVSDDPWKMFIWDWIAGKPSPRSSVEPKEQANDSA